ncbi:hypothetical protein [Schlesneria sp.]|uniref:hypothetical protein n=1 Tax=Schlesneria sp. TaxID=2762018 RepID=UPI002EEFEF7E
MPDVVYDAILGSGVNLRQVTNSSFDPKVESLAGRMSGAAVISDQFIVSSQPEASLSTVDIGGFLTAFGVVGAVVNNGANVTIPFQKRARAGTFVGAGANMVVKGITDCPVVLNPQTITAPRQGAPTAQGQVLFLSSDGMVTPYSETVNQTLAGQLFSAMYGLGPVYINGDLVPRQVGFSVTFGLGWSEPQNYEGSVFASDIFLETIDPVIEVQVEDFDLLASILGGASITNVTAYLRKRASGGTYVADATAQHIKFTFAGGLIKPQAMSAQETKHGNAGLRLEGRTLVASTASAVTAP